VTGERLAPRSPDQWDDDAIAALRSAFPDKVVDAWTAGSTPVPNVLTTLLHHPALAGPWLSYNNVLLWSSALDDRQRELMVLRVAFRTRSEYEWVQHVLLADRFGITADDIDAIAHDGTADAWTPLEHALVAATDQLLDRQCIDDATWSVLAGALDERQLVELVFVVGSYACLAMAFNSFGLQIDAGADTSEVPPLPD
jgi:alkylhydroperoxidase family enzyme